MALVLENQKQQDVFIIQTYRKKFATYSFLVINGTWQGSKETLCFIQALNICALEGLFVADISRDVSQIQQIQSKTTE